MRVYEQTVVVDFNNQNGGVKNKNWALTNKNVD